MDQAVAEQRVPPVVQARVLWNQGLMQEALRVYLKSDPASWASQDILAFRSLRFHAGLANNTAAMLQAASKRAAFPRTAG